MARPHVAVFIAHSVDGYIATDDDSLDWLTAAAAEGEDYGFDAFLADVDVVAMGRSTYEFIQNVDGGTLISQFLDAGLVDEMTLTTVPVLLGSGRPLFHRIATATPLRLVDTRVFSSGMVNLHYRKV